MPSREEENEALARAEYWDERYAKSDGQTATHEWFRSYSDLVPFLERHLFDSFPPTQNPRILHLGAGDSTVPRGLLDYGYKNQTCVDFSPVVIKLMAGQNLEGVTWLCEDVRGMPVIESESIDVAFDKGTLDAMIHGSPWDPPDDVKENTRRYMKEVSRALQATGVFLYITYRQPHFVKPLLNQDNLWDMHMEVLKPSENSFEYYAFVLRKARSG
ncbi:Endothelin-converting enzyme 2 [Cercospora zeina]